MTEYIIKVDENKKDIDGGMPLHDKPQELVRCKDCKKQFTSYCLLAFFGMRKLNDWYCADGVRKDDSE